MNDVRPLQMICLEIVKEVCEKQEVLYSGKRLYAGGGTASRIYPLG